MNTSAKIENNIFNQDFYPTPIEVIQQMLEGVEIADQHFLEPSAGNGNIVDYLKSVGAKSVSTFELNKDLASIISSKSNFLGYDFLDATQEQISHVNCIVMNPPFSKDADHILHAWKMAPEGCQIIALCNNETFGNQFSRGRRELKYIIDANGVYQNLGSVFSTAQRKTNVNVGLVKLFKPVVSKDFDYSGFFTDEEPEGPQVNGLMPYNEVREIVQRYIGAIKCFEEMQGISQKMNLYIKPIGLSDGFSYTITYGKPSTTKEDFAKQLQKTSWEWVFKRLNVKKFVTSGVMKKINKFVETQSQYPFTMANIYKMLEIIVATRSQTMDEALIEVFDKLTMHHHDNRYNVEGWKTNSHYLVNKKFILEWVTEVGFAGEFQIRYNGNQSKMNDLHKALCYITGDNPKDLMRQDEEGNYLELKELNLWPHRLNLEFGTWYDWGFFKIKGFKKGTLHVKFKDLKVWELFNRRIAEIKGYPLPEKI